MSYLDNFFKLLVDVRRIGVAVATRKALNFSARFTVTDNPSTGAVDIDAPGSASSSLTASEVNLGADPATGGQVNTSIGTGGTVVVVMLGDSVTQFPVVTWDGTSTLIIGDPGGAFGGVQISAQSTDEIVLKVGATSRIRVGNVGIGLNGAAPVAPADITGSRSDTTAAGALGQLLTALATRGDITNNSIP